MPKINFTPFGGVSTNAGGLNVSANPITGTASASGNVVNNEDVKVDLNVSGGLGGAAGIKPTIQFGQGEGNATGAQVGGTGGGLAGSLFGPVGAGVGAGVGSAVGSLVGGGFNPSAVHKETKKRDSVFNAFSKAGLFDDGQFIFPDGTTWNVKENNAHDWKYADKKVDKVDRQLHSYETDYTNDLDYVGSMAGISLSRLLAGGKGKAIDQTGSSLGNGFLGRNGYGADFNKDSFNSTMTNARAAYAKKGIHTKEDMLALSNTAFAQGRINDSDHAVMQQTAGLVFDNDYGLAQQLMGGRWDGLKTAGKSPSDNSAHEEPPKNAVSGVRSPIVSPQEAIASVQPFFDNLKQNYPGAVRKPSKIKQTAATAAELLSGVTALGGIYNSVNSATGNNLPKPIDVIKDVGSTVAGLFGGGSSSAPPIPSAPELSAGFQTASDTLGSSNDFFGGFDF